MGKRVAIVGTAETWRETPWGDTDLEVWTLNDAYNLGFPRIDVHFELHPLDSFVYRNPKDPPVTVADIPPMKYLRPHGHIEWLQKKAVDGRVFLQEDPPASWKGNVERFDRAAREAEFKDILFVDPTWRKPYIASGPAWMVLQALHEGVEEIQTYGIHLATDREYVDQRPNWEALLAYAMGKGVKVTIPPTCPIFKSTHVYCYERRISQEREAIQYQIQLVDRDMGKAQGSLADRRWWSWGRGVRRTIADLQVVRSRLSRALDRVNLDDALTRPEWQPQVGPGRRAVEG